MSYIHDSSEKSEIPISSTKETHKTYYERMIEAAGRAERKLREEAGRSERKLREDAGRSYDKMLEEAGRSYDKMMDERELWKEIRLAMKQMSPVEKLSEHEWMIVNSSI